jgi:Fic family protein
LLALLKEEECSYASAIIGHLCLAYIHPYGDGNGRTSRFLMNTLLILSGNDWVVIPVKKRNDYMASLESASVGKDILPFARFVSEL